MAKKTDPSEIEANESQSPEGFPKSIEGTRGDKDSAWQARQWFAQQRGLDTNVGPADTDQAELAAEPKAQAGRTDNMAKTNKKTGSKSTGVTLAVKGGSLGDSFEHAEQFLVKQSMQPAKRDKAKDAPRAVYTLSISGVSTSNQAGTQTVFQLNADALALVLNLAVSQDLVNSGAKFDARFQIIDYATNTVKKESAWNTVGFSWGQYFWLSMGNNWGPNASDYSTPAKWGLTAGVYALRGLVTVQGQSVFAYSGEHVFRVR